MNKIPRLLRLLGAACLAGALCAHAQQDASTENKEEKSGDRFDIPIPVGESVKGIEIPHYGEDGQLQMEFKADVVRRIDDKNLEMENLRVHIVGDNKEDFHVSMPVSTFNTETRILTSNTPTKIEADEFEILGDTAEFDVKTRFSTMTGNVKMIIYNAEELSK